MCFSRASLKHIRFLCAWPWHSLSWRWHHVAAYLVLFGAVSVFIVILCIMPRIYMPSGSLASLTFQRFLLRWDELSGFGMDLSGVIDRWHPQAGKEG